MKVGELIKYLSEFSPHEKIAVFSGESMEINSVSGFIGGPVVIFAGVKKINVQAQDQEYNEAKNTGAAIKFTLASVENSSSNIGRAFIEPYGAHEFVKKGYNSGA